MKVKKVQAEKFREFREVEIREPLAGDYVAVDRMAAKGDMGASDNFRAAALMSRLGTFDGEKLPPEDVLLMRGQDFLELFGTIASPFAFTAESEKQSSSSANMQE